MLSLFDKLAKQVLLIGGCSFFYAQFYLLVHNLIMYLHLILVKIQVWVRLALMLLFVQILHRQVMGQFFSYRGKQGFG
jgi:hypothetical protein